MRGVKTKLRLAAQRWAAAQRQATMAAAAMAAGGGAGMDGSGQGQRDGGADIQQIQQIQQIDAATRDKILERLLAHLEESPEKRMRHGWVLGGDGWVLGGRVGGWLPSGAHWAEYRPLCCTAAWWRLPACSPSLMILVTAFPCPCSSAPPPPPLRPNEHPPVCPPSCIPLPPHSCPSASPLCPRSLKLIHATLATSLRSAQGALRRPLAAPPRPASVRVPLLNISLTFNVSMPSFRSVLSGRRPASSTASPSHPTAAQHAAGSPSGPQRNGSVATRMAAAAAVARTGLATGGRVAFVVEGSGGDGRGAPVAPTPAAPVKPSVGTARDLRGEVPLAFSSPGTSVAQQVGWARTGRGRTRAGS